ncbi:hypothetical protein CEXT_796371 [Caerostris extrusa]|uniref:Uncharacterized protein n=1 Tax=Caerostris extrusa TaxID=172846 RepID=A0AAV4TMK0_CAEEX|nr:hypothetical protein CEXT_796371 [Caerostris extrusa]
MILSSLGWGRGGGGVMEKVVAKTSSPDLGEPTPTYLNSPNRLLDFTQQRYPQFYFFSLLFIPPLSLNTNPPLGIVFCSRRRDKKDLRKLIFERKDLFHSPHRRRTLDRPLLVRLLRACFAFSSSFFNLVLCGGVSGRITSNEIGEETCLRHDPVFSGLGWGGGIGKVVAKTSSPDLGNNYGSKGLI